MEDNKKKIDYKTLNELIKNSNFLLKITLTMFILLIVIIFISIGLFKIFNYLFEKYTLKKEKVWSQDL